MLVLPLWHGCTYVQLLSYLWTALHLCGVLSHPKGRPLGRGMPIGQAHHLLLATLLVVLLQAAERLLN